MTRNVTIATFLLGAALLAPTPASAMIQVDKGIAGARIGNSQDEVRAALGKPRSVRRGRTIFGPFTRFIYRGGLSVQFQGRRNVTSVTTTGLGDRTARGVGVGSTEEEVTTKVKGITCETFGELRSCHTKQLSAGQRVTDFHLTDGKVTRVNVGIVID